MNQCAVVKISSQLSVADGRVQTAYLDRLFQACAEAQAGGWHILIVLSGAVAAGTGPESTQARAAVGQLALAHAVFETAAAHHAKPALILLSREDIVNRVRFQTLEETFDDLLDHGIIPVINENDAAAARKNDFLDNDQLATIVAVAAKAEKLLLLTNVDGVYSDNPKTNAAATIVPEIPNVNLRIIEQLAQGKSLTGRGGMEGKLRAARIATAAGITTVIMDGADPQRIPHVLVRGATFGTRCLPRTHARGDLTFRDRWILSAQNSGASIQLDRGAADAIRQRKSLLAVGIRQTFGTFSEHECVELLDPHRETIALGLTALSSRKLEKLLRGPEKPFNVEVVHADNIHLLL